MKSYNCLAQMRFTRGAYSVMPVQPDHIENIRRWRNEQMDVLRQTSVITREQQEGYYAENIWPQMKLERPSNILFSFFHHDQHIGYGGLVHIAWPHRRSEISFLLDPARVSNFEGYAAAFTHFLDLMKLIAFVHLGMDRLFTETYAIRKHHISVLEASGLRREGVMRSHVIIDGHSTDCLIHGYLRSDYEK